MIVEVLHSDPMTFSHRFSRPNRKKLQAICNLRALFWTPEDPFLGLGDGIALQPSLPLVWSPNITVAAESLIESITMDADGNLVLDYEGILRSASTYTGEYTTVDSASSPHVFAPESDQMYFIALRDSDDDGFPDIEDACPLSDLSESVVIDGCDSGVENLRKWRTSFWMTDAPFPT